MRAALDGSERGERIALLGEETVDGRTRARHVGPQRSELAELAGKRRRGEVVRWEGREVTEGDSPKERRSTLGESLFAGERRVDGRGRALAVAVREEDDNPVVLREVKRLQQRSVAFSQLGPVAEEERDIRAKLRRELVEPLLVERSRQGGVGEAEYGSRVRAAAAEARRDRDLLLDLDVPQRCGACRGREALERSANERVLCIPLDP